MINSYKDLLVWQKSINFVIEVYKVTSKFPREEIYGITSQIRRASVAIASNIAEGRSRGHINEFVQFLKIAYGSAAEVQTQLIIAKSIDYITEKEFVLLDNSVTETMKMLNGLISKLKPKT